MEQRSTDSVLEMQRERLRSGDIPLHNWTLKKHRRSSWFYALMGLSTGIAIGTVEALLIPKYWYVFTALQLALLAYGLLFVRHNWREMQRDHEEMKDELKRFMEMLERVHDGITPP